MPGYNPGVHAANVVADVMRDIQFTREAAIEEVRASADSNSFKDHIMRLLPPVHIPSAHEISCVVYHECGHVMGKLEGGAANIEVRVRSDGSGICIAGEVPDAEANITSILAGAFSDIKFSPRSIHTYAYPTACSDFILARILIDELNASRLWPQLTYRTAAKNSMRFVEKHWPQIQNLALALGDAGELDDFAIRIFAKCGQ
jgi:hypothetical protein